MRGEFAIDAFNAIGIDPVVGDRVMGVVRRDARVGGDDPRDGVWTAGNSL